MDGLSEGDTRINEEEAEAEKDRDEDKEGEGNIDKLLEGDRVFDKDADAVREGDSEAGTQVQQRSA
jgi:hypothetical protein